MKHATSRELAVNMRKLADWLDSKPEFELPDTQAIATGRYIGYESDKGRFLAAVRALGSGKKREGILDSYLRFVADTPEGTEFAIEVYRDVICKLVKPAQPAEYDCEPLLSQAEEAEVGREG